MSLRDGAIEAMNPGPKGYLSKSAADTLDALLDYLTEHATAAIYPMKLHQPSHEALLAALREDTDD